MGSLISLPLWDEARKTVKGDPAVRCVVEAPRGSSAKFKFDAKLKAFVMGKALIKGLTYPFDWGFFPSTVGDDGDPLDVMLFHDVASFSGLVVPAQIVGVLITMQRESEKAEVQRNDRFFAVPVDSHREDELNDVSQISKRTRDELERFFFDTSALEAKSIEFDGWRGPKHAMRLLNEGHDRFLKKKKQ